ncbi:hypothetical protein SAMN06295924_11122 [Rathayibacter rathayi NCPPB 2980 = VKM Ac-1601]|nr:hypothetical protein SAMN06295924_11122 [Rathayibacter rathayi NCPPB 2980 = VKM Ac-1601]
MCVHRPMARSSQPDDRGPSPRDEAGYLCDDEGTGSGYREPRRGHGKDQHHPRPGSFVRSILLRGLERDECQRALHRRPRRHAARTVLISEQPSRNRTHFWDVLAPAISPSWSAQQRLSSPLAGVGLPVTPSSAPSRALTSRSTTPPRRMTGTITGTSTAPCHRPTPLTHGTRTVPPLGVLHLGLLTKRAVLRGIHQLRGFSCRLRQHRHGRLRQRPLVERRRGRSPLTDLHESPPASPTPSPSARSPRDWAHRSTSASRPASRAPPV